MYIVEINDKLDKAAAQRLIDIIASIETKVFGSGCWNREGLTEYSRNDYDILAAAADFCPGNGAAVKTPDGIFDAVKAVPMAWSGLTEGPEAMCRITGYALMRCLDDAELLRIAVLEDYRRKGTASKLLRFMKERAAEMGASCMLLEVRSANLAAAGLYKKEGFAAIGIRKGYYHAPSDDAVIMKAEI